MNDGFRRVPPATKIASELRIDLSTAKVIRHILKREFPYHEPRLGVPQTDAWVRQCHNEPSWREQAEHAVDVLLGTHGVEALFATGGRKSQAYGWPEFTYCNAGDPYVATLVFDHYADAVYIEGYGDALVRHEKRGVHFD